MYFLTRTIRPSGVPIARWVCANRYCESHGSTQFKLTLFLFRGIMKIWFAVTLAVLGFIDKKLTKIIAPNFNLKRQKSTAEKNCLFNL